MKRWLVAAGLAALAVGTAAVTASAADLDYRDVPRDRYGSAYEDPRYADVYGRPPAPPPVTAYRDYAPPIPREPVYRDEYQPPYPPRYAEAPPRHYAYGAKPGCTPKDEIQYQLEREGWRGFQDPQVIDKDTAFLRARRPNGQLFQLKVDRCSGVGCR